MADHSARTGRRRKNAAPIGLVFILLAAVGLVAVLILTVTMTFDFIDNSDRTAEFEELIRPVLMFDPVPYEDPNDLDPAFVLRSAMWSALLGEKRGNYQYDEMRLLIVPASDLDVQATSLFGPNIVLHHQSFGSYDATFVYDSDTETYRVPIVAQIGNYTPRIDEITTDGDEIRLKVGYIPPETLWTADQAQAEEDGERLPDKYMIYVLKENRDSYYIAAIRDIEGAGLPGGDYSGSEVVVPNLPGMPEESSAAEQSGEEDSQADTSESSDEDAESSEEDSTEDEA